MASPLIEFCEQTNPKILNEIRRSEFHNATRVQQSFLTSMEKRALQWMATRTPEWINSDHLTPPSASPHKSWRASATHG